jgi:soluble lytic murein transglycosylase-like protein
MVGVAAFLMIQGPTLSRAAEPYRLATVAQTGHGWLNFRSPMPFVLGPNDIWRLSATQRDRREGRLWMKNDSGLEQCGLPFVVDRILPGNPRCERLPASFYIGMRHLFPKNPQTPAEKIGAPEPATQADDAVRSVSVRQEFQVYLVQRRDSLWKIARQFAMQPRTLAEINNLGTGENLQIGRPLKVRISSPRELTLELTSPFKIGNPSLLDQIRLTDGRPVPRWLLKGFAVEIVERPSSPNREVIRETNRDDPTVVVHFHLEEDHLQAKAKQFRSIVLTHAQRYNLDPALITAMIHTESSFDPFARSRSSAYGLMQLVPHTAGREAYMTVYGQDHPLSPEYLYDPDNNIELGAAYLNILQDRYLRAITNPISRTYCAVAAYHAGPSNVGRAFIPQQSIQQATPVINRLTPADVYDRLVQALPAMESRNYVRSVISRLKKYREWYSQSDNHQT